MWIVSQRNHATTPGDGEALEVGDRAAATDHGKQPFVRVTKRLARLARQGARNHPRGVRSHLDRRRRDTRGVLRVARRRPSSVDGERRVADHEDVWHLRNRQIGADHARPRDRLHDPSFG
jgi:hypothetical protein